MLGDVVTTKVLQTLFGDTISQKPASYYSASAVLLIILLAKYTTVMR